MTAHITRRAVVGFKAEGTEGTWAEPSLAADNSTTIYDANFTVEPNIFDRKPAKLGLSTLPGLLGGQLARLTFRMELSSHGDGSDLDKQPAYAPALAACGWTFYGAGATAHCLTQAGAVVTTAPDPGERMTQDVSGAKANYIRTTGGSHLIYNNDSGTISNGDNWVGDVTGLVLTTTGDAAEYGGVFVLNSSPSSYSCHLMNPYDNTDATFRQLRGGRGTWTLSAGGVGEVVFWDIEVLGVMRDVADSTIITPAYDDYAGLAFIGNDFFTGGAATPANTIFNTFSIDSNAELTPRDNANDADGFLSVQLSDRDIQGTFDPELIEVGTEDFYDHFDSQTAGTLEFALGATAGDRVEVYCPNVRYRGYTGAERNNIAITEIPFGLHRKGVTEDNEMFIITR